MLLKTKAILGAVALLASCSFATKASAIGASYDFSANDARSYINFNAYSTETEKSYYLDSPFFEFDPAQNFILANESLTGQFSYDTDAPVSYTNTRPDRTYTSYDSENLSLDLASGDGDTVRFDFASNRASVSTYTNPERRYFQANGWQPNTPITLSGDPDSGEPNGCEFEFCEDSLVVDLPVDQLREDNPALFDGIERISVRVDGYDRSAPYNLSSATFGMRQDTLLPTDGVLPDSLPALSESNFTWASMHFIPDSYFWGQSVESILDNDFNDIPFDSVQYQQIDEFVGNLHFDMSLSVQYDVTELTQLDQGTTPHNPILPDPGGSMEEGFEFTFDIPDPDEFTFVDPFVAIGYDYVVTGDAAFSAVLLPEDIGDNLFDLWLFDGTDYVDSGIDLTGGVAYTFDAGGVDQFRILGIETDEFLDPDDASAFVTGLQFLLGTGTTSISMSQTPITEFVDVPSPSSGVLLLMAGITGMFTRRKNA